jgi:hypothetical protein
MESVASTRELPLPGSYLQPWPMPKGIGVLQVRHFLGLTQVFGMVRANW